jgi:hypothetical protein
MLRTELDEAGGVDDENLSLTGTEREKPADVLKALEELQLLAQLDGQ